MIDWNEICETTRVTGPMPITFEYLGVSHGHATPHVTIRATMPTVDTRDAKAPFVFMIDYPVANIHTTRAALRALHQIAQRMYLHELGEHFRWGVNQPFEPRH